MTIGVTHTASTEVALAAGTSATTVASDESLLAEIAGGSRLAMRNLYLRHERRVFRFVMRMVGDRCLAEEVLSEVFFDVWKKADHFQGRSAVSTWLLGIARHKALTAAAAKSRPFESLDGAAAMSVVDPTADPDATMLDHERRTILRRCLEALSPEHREVIDLVYYQEKTIRQIADLLAIPENTVKTRMFYARKRLAALVEAASDVRPATASLH
jgi:RNA polymerase sigma-70 factor (ECF subfamily)